MSLTTFSQFFYDLQITPDNLYLDFDEGSGELTAEVDLGSYSPVQGLTKIADAMTTAGTQAYSITLDRATRLVTISAPGPFDLLVSTGSSVGSDCFSTIGFNGADRTGSNSYTGDTPILSVYRPQFVLQDYIKPDHWQKLIDPTSKKTADGKIEVIKFGVETFVQMNIKFATNKKMSNQVIKNNPSGVEDLAAFMQFAVTKSQVEFMPDLSDPNTYLTLILERTSEDQNGTAFRLRELYDRGLPEFFETGIISWRVIE